MLDNIRLGFATNSSSSHSILMFKDVNAVPATSDNNREYGWNEFILSDLKSKIEYVAIDRSTNHENYESFFEEFKDWLDHETIADIWEKTNKGYGDYYIDHQSKGLTSDIDISFFSDPRVVIAGGNDNSDEKFSESFSNVVEFNPNDENVTIRREPGFVTYFFKNNGTKLRFSDNGKYVDKTSYPELVDLKITNYCPHECTFCYQDSTKEGKHADVNYVRELISELARNGVFEIALGGGEALLHPNIVEILEFCLFQGIVPNVTTNGIKWSTNERLVSLMKKIYVVDSYLKERARFGEYHYHAAIGVSVNSVNEFKKLDAIKKILGNNTNIVPQHIVGMHDLGQILDHLSSSHNKNQILLLGYKPVGRGTEPPILITQEDVIKHLSKYRTGYDRPVISVDTAFLNQYDISSIAHKCSFSSQEGAFSCYIDAVEKTISRSSYEPKANHVPLHKTTDIKGIFANF